MLENKLSWYLLNKIRLKQIYLSKDLTLNLPIILKHISLIN